MRSKFGYFHVLKRIHKDLFTKNVFMKVVALLITLMLWFAVTSTKKVELVKKIPLNFITTHGYVATNNLNGEIEVRFLGPSAFLREVMERKETLNVDVRDKKPGMHSYKLYNDIIKKLPLGVRVVGFYPADINFKIETVESKKVKVLPSFKGKLPEGYKIKKVSVEPDTVEVEGPQELLSATQEIYTSVVDLSKIDNTSTFSIGIDPKYISKFQNISYQKFSLYVEVEPFVLTKKFFGIQVYSMGSRDFKLSKNSVTVTVQGSKLALERLTASDIKASVDLSFNAPGTYNENVVVKVPNGIQLMNVEPKKINVIVH